MPKGGPGGRGAFVVGDWQNGAIYQLDPTYFFDDCGSATGGPISFVRSFQHIGAATDPASGQMIETEGRMLKFNGFMADMQGGGTPISAQADPQVGLRWSDDRGFTWGNAVLQPMGAQGIYQTWPTWKGLGIARDRIFELSWSSPGPTALNGAWVDADVGSF